MPAYFLSAFSDMKSALQNATHFGFRWAGFLRTSMRHRATALYRSKLLAEKISFLLFQSFCWAIKFEIVRALLIIQLAASRQDATLRDVSILPQTLAPAPSHLPLHDEYAANLQD